MDASLLHASREGLAALLRELGYDREAVRVLRERGAV